MGRCWFMKGSTVDLIESLCLNATTGKGFLTYSGPLANHLSDEARKLAREASQSPTDTDKLIEVVQLHLSPDLLLAHDLLSTLCVASTWPHQSVESVQAADPPLDSVLADARMWTQVWVWVWVTFELTPFNGRVTNLYHASKTPSLTDTHAHGHAQTQNLT